MFTGNYDNFNFCDCRLVSISGDRGKKAKYNGECYPKLAPQKEFWAVWNNNIGKISEEENTRYYVEEYCKQVLAKLDPVEVYSDLKDKILLCYEKPNDFCHRHIVAAWIKLLLKVDVPEVIIKDNKFQIIERTQKLDILLEEIIKNMRSFTSLNTLRSFEKGDRINKELYAFLIKAKKQTYANSNAKKLISSRQGSEDYEYVNGNMIYHDTYFGGKKFMGEEVVYLDSNIPIWGMNYYGITIDDTLSEEAVDKALRPALMLVGEDKDIIPVRGPQLFQNGEYEYIFKVNGDLDYFDGVETINKNKVKVYELKCHGGIIKK